MRSRCLCLASFASFLFATLTPPASAVDWPTWRFDAGRSAATPEELPTEPELHRTRSMPSFEPAWP
ncbi:MAG: hypothetical protein H8E37_14455 [Planctomycetes bacterium]|nr:hypothetical protein [Planctomycetota bacterium]